MAEDTRTELRELVADRLRAAGGRMTRKRERVLATLERMDRPASAEQIREQAELPASDLVTVYRNLDTLEGLGVLQRVPLENGTHLFELTAPDEHYHHLICRHCHRAERLELCVGTGINTLARAKGYADITHTLEIYGLCPECRDR